MVCFEPHCPNTMSCRDRHVRGLPCPRGSLQRMTLPAPWNVTTETREQWDFQSPLNGLNLNSPMRGYCVGPCNSRDSRFDPDRYPKILNTLVPHIPFLTLSGWEHEEVGREGREGVVECKRKIIFHVYLSQNQAVLCWQNLGRLRSWQARLSLCLHEHVSASLILC